MTKRALALLLVAGIFTGCAGAQRPDPDAMGIPKRSRDATIGTLLGIPLGLIGGAIVGGVADSRPSEDPGLDGALVGAGAGLLIGPLVGALLGHLEDEHVRRQEAEEELRAK